MAQFTVVSWNYRDTPGVLDSNISLGYSYWEEALKSRGIKKYVILVTCNRLELYFYWNLTDTSGFQNSVIKRDEDAVRHLFRVASGLESMSVGENDILRQIKESYETALERGHVNKPLSAIFRKSLSIGKRVRERTSISKGKTSIPSIAIEKLKSKFGIEGKKVLIIGTGRMAISLGKYIGKENPASITVCGRNPEKTMEAATILNCKFASLRNMKEEIKENDIILTATTSSEILIKREDMIWAGRDKFFVDISKPDNIENLTESIEGIHVMNIGSLENVMEMNRSMKKKEILAAGNMVEEEIEKTMKKFKEIEYDDLIAHMYRYSRLKQKEEVEEFKREISKGTDIDSAIYAMANSLSKKVLSPYTAAFRKMIETSDPKELNRFLSELKTAIHGEEFGEIDDIMNT
ncbi:glutamyl-tRNA reductase [Oxyplasma meridianum]|uniref:Glutamyl-tRNA reductase n=1 Tax=Oxyplasma meridianum TaxID=3073602 RepID=A0AAX4NGL6_9ARCH